MPPTVKNKRKNKAVSGKNLDEFRIEHGLSVAQACYLFGIGNNNLWYLHTRKQVVDQSIAILYELYQQFPEMIPKNDFPFDEFMKKHNYSLDDLVRITGRKYATTKGWLATSRPDTYIIRLLNVIEALTNANSSNIHTIEKTIMKVNQQ